MEQIRFIFFYHFLIKNLKKYRKVFNKIKHIASYNIVIRNSFFPFFMTVIAIIFYKFLLALTLYFDIIRISQYFLHQTYNVIMK